MKISYRIINPNVINYRDYKSFSNEGFREPLHKNVKGELSQHFDKTFSSFTNICNTVLDKQLPGKNVHQSPEIINRL